MVNVYLMLSMNNLSRSDKKTGNDRSPIVTTVSMHHSCRWMTQKLGRLLLALADLFGL